jgi:sulfur-carrier protein adenylyltransferase/sulfurtransferase
MERQEPFVNQTLAYRALAMLARLFRYGRLNYHGCFVRLRNGRSAPILIDPYGWAGMQSGRKETVVFGSASDV